MLFKYGAGELVGLLAICIICYLIYLFVKSRYSKDRMKSGAKELGKSVKEAGADFKDIAREFREGVNEIKGSVSTEGKQQSF